MKKYFLSPNKVAVMISFLTPLLTLMALRSSMIEQEIMEPEHNNKLGYIVKVLPNAYGLLHAQRNPDTCWNFYDELLLCRIESDYRRLHRFQRGGVEIMDFWPEGLVYQSDCDYQAPWHLSSVNGRFPPDAVYAFDKSKQPPSTVYVVDGWCDVAHPQFEGRASRAPAFNNGSYGSHGTHVAGLIGSKRYGVNKNARIVSVQVLDGYGSGSWSAIIAGLNWIASTRRPRDSVINMSLGGGYASVLNQALQIMVGRGWRIVVAAGNSREDACMKSPASAEGVLAVGAYDVQGQFASFSNYGSCVGINAPGVDILSTIPNGGTAWMSGTSMASPLVAGVWSLIANRDRDQFVKLVAKQHAFGRLPADTVSTYAQWLPSGVRCARVSHDRFTFLNQQQEQM